MLEKGLSLTTAYGLAIAQNVAAIVASCSTGFVAEIVGRKRNLIISFGVEAVSIIIMATINGGVGVILAACIFLGFAINYSITAVQPLLAEAYPTEFRNTGGGELPCIWTNWCGKRSDHHRYDYRDGSRLYHFVFVLCGSAGNRSFSANVFNPAGNKGKSLDELAEMKSE